MSPASSLKSRAIVEAIGKGDLSAEAQLIGQYRPRLVKFLARATYQNPIAEDWCHDSLLVTIRRLRAGRLTDPEKLQGFLYGVARKMLLAHRRKELQATAIVVGLHELWTDAESPIGATEYAETARLIGIAIARLDSPRDRELLRCHYGLDGQRSPIRADIGLNPSGYRKALERARRRIRPILEQLGVSSAIAMHKETRCARRCAAATSALRAARAATARKTGGYVPVTYTCRAPICVR